MNATAVMPRDDLPSVNMHLYGPVNQPPLQQLDQHHRHASFDLLPTSVASVASVAMAPSHGLLYPPPPQDPTPLVSSVSTTSSTAAPESCASSTASLELKRDSSEDRDHRFRCDSSLTGGDARLSICSTSGTVYESVVVVGHIYGSDNVVYYLLEVKSWEMPLDGYVIRRRYNDFKELHRQLSLCMPTTGGVRRGSAPAATGPTVHNHNQRQNSMMNRQPNSRGISVYTSALLCNPLPSARPETSPLWSPTRPRFDSHRRNSITSLRLDGNDDAASEPRTHHSFRDYDTRFSAPTMPTNRPPWSNSPGLIDLPFHTVNFDRDGRPLLPSMPPGGVSSFFSTREMLIKYRVEKFNRMLAAVLSDTSSNVAQLLMNFIQDKPSAPQTYVSLNQYAPVDMPWSVERHARRRTSIKKAMQNHLAQAG